MWLYRIALALAALPASDGAPAREVPGAAAPFESFTLPDDWQSRYWADPDAQHLLGLEPSALAALVPVQAGFRFCRCPSCPATEVDDPLRWSPRTPERVSCSRCGAAFPSEAIPAKSNGAVPEETIEVRPGVIHRYPYHAPEPADQRYPEERLYLAAKRDYEAREALAKAALYAAVRHRRPGAGLEADPRLARLASVILIRFAQVYPNYAAHYDQPGQPKYLQPADLRPPYRQGYRTGRWDWLGCLEVPMNLVIAYALVRDDPALAEAGKLLGVADPGRVIEQNLFRRAARFVQEQTEEYNESSLAAYRGLIAVGRLLGDPDLIHDAVTRLEGLARRGFYHDGWWHQGGTEDHRRVMAQLDGWIDRLLAGYADPPGYAPRFGPRFDGLPGAAVVPQVELARLAHAATLGGSGGGASEVQTVSWPPAQPRSIRRQSLLLGGAGLAHLCLGSGPDAFDLQLRGLGDAGERTARLALRVEVGGRPVLDDLDEQAPRPDGWDRGTVSHNTVSVDGLNQRENLVSARRPAPGAEVLFYAADPDLQVVAFEDRHAYAGRARAYRHVVAASSGPRTRYAVSVFEVDGGAQHDQFFHGPAAVPSRWRLPLATSPGPRSLLPPGLVYIPNARAEDGRWFVQGYGAFQDLSVAEAPGFVQARLEGINPSLRLHLLSDLPATLVVGSSPGPGSESPGRGTLMVRRRAADEQPLRSLFVTVLEPVGPAFPPLARVGRVAASEPAVVLLIDGADGVEHLVLNLRPGTVIKVRLADGRELRTDGMLVRLRGDDLVLVGGTVARLGEIERRHERVAGQILEARRVGDRRAHGVFRVNVEVNGPAALVGRALIVRHGDGSSRGWTVDRVARSDRGTSLLFVREEPGFHVDPESGDAVYDQYPGMRVPGPHRFVVNSISR